MWTLLDGYDDETDDDGCDDETDDEGCDLETDDFTELVYLVPNLKKILNKTLFTTNLP